MLFEIVVLKNFTKLLGKHLCRSLAFNKVAGFRLFKNTFFYRTPPVAASVFWIEIPDSDSRSRRVCYITLKWVKEFHNGTVNRVMSRGTNRTVVEYTDRENIPSNKTEALTKSINMDILVIGSLNQLIIRTLPSG